jgi:hypothetical protein
MSRWFFKTTLALVALLPLAANAQRAVVVSSSAPVPIVPASRVSYYTAPVYTPPAPAVSYYTPPAPVVSYYTPPAPVVSYYTPPAPVVSYYAAPAVSYYAPTVSYYAPAVTPISVTRYRYGLFGLRRGEIVTYGSTGVVAAPVRVSGYYTPTYIYP